MKDNVTKFHECIKKLVFKYTKETILIVKKNPDEKLCLTLLMELSWKYFDYFTKIVNEHMNGDPKTKYKNPLLLEDENIDNLKKYWAIYSYKKYTKKIEPIKYQIDLPVIEKLLKKISKSSEIIYFNPFYIMLIIDSFYNYRFLFEIMDKNKIKLNGKFMNELLEFWKDYDLFKKTEVPKNIIQYFNNDKNKTYYAFLEEPIGKLKKISKMDIPDNILKFSKLTGIKKSRNITFKNFIQIYTYLRITLNQKFAIPKENFYLI